MATHLDDEEQLEELKRWWKENWLALVIGLGVGFGAIGGWQTYKGWKDKQSTTASALYEDLKKTLEGGKREDATPIADKLAADFSRTPYAAAAALRIAQSAAEHDEMDEAARRLTWVIDHGHDDAMVGLARVRKARVLFASGKNDDALKLLDAAPDAYTGLAQELRGDIQLAKGDKAAARAAYEKALAATDEKASNRSLLQQKLDDLAPPAQS